MTKNFLRIYPKILFAFLFIVSIYSCSESQDVVTNPTPQSNTVSGTVTFADTNFITSGGVYDIGVFPNPSNPPTYWFGPPTAFDTLVITNNNGLYQANYTISSVPDGDYVVAVGFRKDSGGQSPVMGVYGCDTAHTSCFLNPQRVSIVNNAGVDGINILSWADTTNKIF